MKILIGQIQLRDQSRSQFSCKKNASVQSPASEINLNPGQFKTRDNSKLRVR